MITKSELQATGGMAGAHSPFAWKTGAGPLAVAGFSSALACIDGSEQAGAVLAWADALRRRLHVSLRTLRVLDTAADNAAPPDPVTWEMRRIEAQNRIEGLLELSGVEDDGIAGVEVAVGQFQERLQAFFAKNPVDLCLIGAVGEGMRPGCTIGHTARYIVETAPCSVLIVPPGATPEPGQAAVSIRRLMVPLDCSRRAEVALPVAVALADAFDAELVVAHALPEPMITEIGPPDEADIALCRNITQHNRKAADRYMSRLRARLALDRRAVRTLIVNGGDPRHRLAQVVAEEAADLIVIAVKGAGGYADQSLGSVADFLVTHMRKPLLVVRPARTHAAPARAIRRDPDGLDNPGRGWV